MSILPSLPTPTLNILPTPKISLEIGSYKERFSEVQVNSDAAIILRNRPGKKQLFPINEDT